MSITDSMRKAFDNCTVIAGVENDFECVYITKAAAMSYLDEIDVAFRELAQTAARDEPIIRCKDCKHYELEGMYKGCCLLHLERMTGYDPLSDSSYDNDIGMYAMPPDGFCSSAEWRDACETD